MADALEPPQDNSDRESRRHTSMFRSDNLNQPSDGAQDDGAGVGGAAASDSASDFDSTHVDSFADALMIILKHCHRGANAGPNFLGRAKHELHVCHGSPALSPDMAGLVGEAMTGRWPRWPVCERSGSRFGSHLGVSGGATQGRRAAASNLAARAGTRIATDAISAGTEEVAAAVPPPQPSSALPSAGGSDSAYSVGRMVTR